MMDPQAKLESLTRSRVGREAMKQARKLTVYVTAFLYLSVSLPCTNRRFKPLILILCSLAPVVAVKFTPQLTNLTVRHTVRD